MPFLAGHLLSAEMLLKISLSLTLSQEFRIFEICLLDQDLVSTKSYLVILASVRLSDFGLTKKTRKSDSLTSEFHSGCKKLVFENVSFEFFKSLFNRSIGIRL